MFKIYLALAVASLAALGACGRAPAASVCSSNDTRADYQCAVEALGEGYSLDLPVDASTGTLHTPTGDVSVTIVQNIEACATTCEVVGQYRVNTNTTTLHTSTTTTTDVSTSREILLVGGSTAWTLLHEIGHSQGLLHDTVDNVDTTIMAPYDEGQTLTYDAIAQFKAKLGKY